MMTMGEILKQPAKHRRKPYSKPEVKRVQLRPEEAVLGGCKIAGGGPGAFQAICSAPVNCSTIGTS
jgi:hypothetical protein